jgi:acyl transferase domain-containing protein/thioesterase domain-containing protein
MTTDPLDVSPNDIAITGMALRVPGASTVDEFWRNLREGRESIRTLTDEELVAAGESPARMTNPNYVRRTADLDGMEMFDAEFFGLSPKEAAIMDPQHRQFLECAWEAMEDAGRTPNTIAGPVGVFAGCGMGSYFYFNVCSNRQLVDQVGMFLLRHTGNDKDFLATRASFAFDLRGPSVNVQTACSTSLVAVHYACQSLLNGETDMALAGGVTIELPHRRGYLHQEGEILSPDGHCRAFDHRAAGTVFGSGVGVVVLRRLSDALADGDIVHGIIKASAINNDGGSKAGYLAPSVNGQAEAIIEAQGLAGVEADSIQYVECHGTGTYLGDPIEIEALTQAFRQSTDRKGFCRVGSVKTNIGHLDTAAGVVSLIKATLSLKNREIPPSLGFEKPNPAIDFAGSPFVVNAELTPWPAVSGPRRAAVNSLGVGGTNAHVILEEAPVRVRSGETRDDGAQILLISAKHRKALDGAIGRLSARLAAGDLSLADVAHTLHAGRKPFEQRRVVAVRDQQDAVEALSANDPRRLFTHTVLDEPHGAVFLFPGGGAQHVGMAQALYTVDAAFRASVNEGLSHLPKAAEDEIRSVWFSSGEEPLDAARSFLRPSLQLPAILIVEVAMARLWMDWGVKPTALIGHSMGENAAACIAGVMSYRDAVNLVRLRGELFDTVEKGGMLSVPLSLATLKALLPAELDIASVNAPELCVVSGRDEDLERFRLALAEQEIEASRIAIDIAAHSRMLEDILPRFEDFLRSIRLSAPAIPIVSNRSGTWLTATEACDPRYWVGHLRSTVHFADGMAALAAQAGRVYIEVGPGRALASLAKLQNGIDANQVINSLPHAGEASDDHLHFLTAVGRAWATGLDVDVERSWRHAAPQRVSLPTYAFQHQRYFIDRVKPQASSAPAEENLVRLPHMTDWGYRPTWKQSLADVTVDAGRTPRNWLVFLDETGLGQTLVAHLRALGHDVRTVSLGDGFARRSREDYVLCAEDGRPGYDALVAGLVEEGPFPENIVHLWLVTEGEAHRPGSSFFDRVQECGFYSLLHLGQAMGDAAISGTHLSVVTNGMHRVGAEALPYPTKATALGPGLVMPKELAGVTVRMIDLPVATSAPETNAKGLQAVVRGAFGNAPAALVSPPDDTLQQLLDDLLATPACEVVAYRRGRRWARVHERLPLAPAEGGVSFRKGGVYLITGGLGDLALAMGRTLARQYGAKLVLLGRTALPDRSEWPSWRRLHAGTDRTSRAIAAISELEALGAEVLYQTADVGDPEQMTAALKAAKDRFGILHGVLHTAGVVDDKPLQLKTFAETENVLAPKVHGTTVLDRVLEGEPLDFLVLFSSTSTDTAPAGQADYVAANAYLNAYAESRADRQDRKTIAVHWGIWNEVGLAARATGLPGDPAASHDTIVGSARGPLFDTWVEDADGTVWLEFTASPQTHWMWSEHRLVSGLPILPGTGYIELLAQAAREYGLPDGITIEDLMFLRPLDITDGAVKRVRVRFEQQMKGFAAYVAAEGDVGHTFVIHAEALVRAGIAPALVAHIDPAPVKPWRIERRADGEKALRSVQEDHIRFGPRWSVLQSLSLGEREAVARLTLPAIFGGDLSIGAVMHPGLLDIATGYAMELIPGYDPRDVLWAPLSYGHLRIHGPLPADIISHVRLSDTNAEQGYASFDIIITSVDGTILVEIERFAVKRLADDAGFADRRAQPPIPVQSPAIQALAAQVRQGILPSEGLELLARAMATGERQPIVSTMPLDGLKAAAERRAKQDVAPGQLFDRPDLEADYIEPRNEIERTLAGYWSELLGIKRVGVNDNFFDIGGHSLIAVRLFRMIRQAYAVDLPISVLFEAPTIAACAELIGDSTVKSENSDDPAAAKDEPPATRSTHLVPMNGGRGGNEIPFFICAGMFGNVLNLRHLALQIGSDRPVYGLQARGLYGGQAPHETFEEMAHDYIAEIRGVQPHGPYLLGGFSGGGLVAYEMARQLVAAGETVAEVIMLDTPVPNRDVLSLFDRIVMKVQDLKRERGAFVGKWLHSRQAWLREQQARQSAANEDLSAADFHNESIHAAFLRALARYEVAPYEGSLFLLRPKMNVVYRLPGGRLLQDGRNPVSEDNGWSPFARGLTVAEVPGDHDSMVLNPNVRVLADRIRRRLRDIDSNNTSRPSAVIAAE